MHHADRAADPVVHAKGIIALQEPQVAALVPAVDI